MFHDDESYEFYPTEMDELFLEMKAKMKDRLSDDIKNHIKSMKSSTFRRSIYPILHILIQ